MLSNSCRYGIRAVIYLANQPDLSVKTGIKKISKDLDLPLPFLAKILQRLAKQKILSSSKGPNGGFSLLKDPKKITLLDIIDTIDGNDFFVNCVIHKGTCTSVEEDRIPCAIHEEFKKIRSDIVDLFGTKTIYELVERANNGELITI